MSSWAARWAERHVRTAVMSQPHRTGTGSGDCKTSRCKACPRPSRSGCCDGGARILIASGKPFPMRSRMSPGRDFAGAPGGRTLRDSGSRRGPAASSIGLTAERRHGLRALRRRAGEHGVECPSGRHRRLEHAQGGALRGYGTILVDLERRCPIGLLADRRPAMYSARLRQRVSSSVSTSPSWMTTVSSGCLSRGADTLERDGLWPRRVTAL